MSLPIPAKILQQHAVVLGKTGAGKSSKLRVIVEHLLGHGKRVCVVDPKGDWWGLKSGADGKSEGFPVIAFGDFKNAEASDVPINASSGKHIAELITSGNRPCILGFRGWMPGALVKFWLDFAPALFNAQSGELYLVIDEVHNFAPKGKILDPDAGRCIHWTNRLMSEGRGLGLVCFIASQRPQKVHNDTLTCCETLIAARVVHKADRMAVKDWIDGCGDGEKGAEVLNGLAQLKREQAWVWSPEAGFGPEIITWPMFGTFDSFAPPQLQKKVSTQGWSSVNLDEVKSKLATVIEEAKANDPASLKAEVRRQQAEIEKLQKQAGHRSAEIRSVEPEIRISEIPALTAQEKKLLERGLDQCERALASFEKLQAKTTESIADMRRFFEPIIARIKGGEELRRSLAVKPTVKKLPPIVRRQSSPGSAHAPAGMDIEGAIAITATQQRILDAIAWYESVGVEQPTTLQIGAIALIDPMGGHFSNVTGPLSSGGLITRGNGTIALTNEGRAIARVPESIETLGDYHAMLMDRVRKCKSAGGKTVEILEFIIAAGGAEISTAEIGEGCHIDPMGGHFSNMIGPLGTLGLIDRRSGKVKPTEILFPKCFN